MDRITATLCAEQADRAARGLSKYGVYLADASLSRKQVLQHLKEELLDAAAYIQKLILLAEETEAGSKDV